ncbi:MAG: hypothetical protein OEU86_03815 [Gammaproteobacteria bacterium]|nr:hypothetical protein [Gammaproteobacteria bacterium]
MPTSLTHLTIKKLTQKSLWLLSALALTLNAHAGGHDKGEMDHSQMDHSKMDHSQPGGHQMSPEQMKELRAKIPLYDSYTDEQIMAGMARMKNTWGKVGDTSLKGEVGIIALAHGFKEPGNSQFIERYERAGKKYPTTYAFGMAMMTSDTIQEAVSALEDAGAKTIVVIPTTTADNSTLVQQWDYIFDKTDKSAYLDVPRVKSKANLVWTDTPTANPIMAEIMLDYAKELSTNPSNELVIIMGHGPQSAVDNEKELEILRKHAAYLKAEGGFMDVRVRNVQDDSLPIIRAGNVDVIRYWAQSAAAEGRDVIIVHTALTQSNVVKRMTKDVEGVGKFNNKGLMQHERFDDWIEEVVSNASKEAMASNQ